MNIMDLQIGQQDVTLEDAELVEKGSPREVVTRTGMKILVSNGAVKDATGVIPISIWRDDIPRVKQGDRLRVTGAVVKEFRGKPAINLVKGSVIEVLP